MADAQVPGARATARPVVYSIDAGLPFVDTLARGLTDRFGKGPADLSRVTVLLPTRRAVRALREAFLRASGGEPMLLPLMRPIGDVEEEELAIEIAAGLAGGADSTLSIPSAMPELKRQLLLANLILTWGKQRGVGPGDAAQAGRLAAELARLLDQVQTERLSFDALTGLVPEDYARHWQLTLDFLRILSEHWPSILAERGAIDQAARRNRLLEALTERWRHAPPAHPVVAAGSTGSIPATADLLAVVARLPRGAVVLPGLDLRLDDEGWDAVDPAHPQFGMKQLLAHLRTSREEVLAWPDGAAAVASDAVRGTLLSEVMRPAATSERWHEFAEAPEAVGVEGGSGSGITRITCPGPREEAGVIALAMREALETPARTAALVTTDRGLARRVAAELARWDIAVDDSAGTPLADTPPGVFLQLCADMLASGLAPVSLLAALKHPLAAGGLAPGAFRRFVRRLEVRALRGPRPGPGFAALRGAVGRKAGQKDLRDWISGIEALARPFAAALRKRRIPLADILAAHVAFAEALAASNEADGAARLWAGEAGEGLALFVEELADASADLPPLSGASYPSLLDSLVAGRVVRPRYGLHGRLFIWGPLEARLQRADVLILGGLNEGTWPRAAEVDPWLSRPMRERFGLPSPERRIGLSAHDFAQAAAAPDVVLTRSEKVEGAPTVPSRWLLRLEALIGEPAGREAQRAADLLHWQAALNEPAAVTPVKPPSFAPPLDARPRRLSVSAVETLMRDPYSVYARYILGLRALDPMDADPGAAERGGFIHKALDDFVAAFPKDLPDDALDRLLEFGEAAFRSSLDLPGVWAFWWPSFEQIAEWFVAFERERRRKVQVVSSEASGELRLDLPGGPFVLTARADRIDRFAGGGLAIIDYKTGQTPTNKDIDRGFSPQLPLEAAMAVAGAFAGIAAARIEQLAYWRLSGGADAGKEYVLKRDAMEYAAEARAGLERLIMSFDDPARPYLSRPRPHALPRFSDYEHLARVKEWSSGTRGES